MELQDYIEEIKQVLIKQLGTFDIQSEIHYDTPLLILPKNKIFEVVKLLKNDTQFGLDFLTTMCGLHFPDNDKELEFGMMYQLHNMSNNTRLRIKTFFSREDLVLDSLTSLWATANWMEREAFDFYGFQFKGHPNLSRILNMDEMDYHPLRKEYRLEDGSRLDKEDKYFGR